MRLICPNCGAQYAVDDRVIPETGRDVQCSSCGHTWFQRHPDFDPDLAEELGYDQPSPVSRPKDPEPASAAEEVAQSETSGAPDGRSEDGGEDRLDQPDVDWEPASEEAGDASNEEGGAADGGLTEVAAMEQPDADTTAEGHRAEEPGGGPPRRRVGDDVLSVLREEAEREQAARRAESGPPEYQPELDMSAPEPAPKTGTAAYTETDRDDQFAPYGFTPAGYPAPAPSRRGLLPDVEEVSTSLDGEDASAEGWQLDEMETRSRRKRGSRLGLGLAFLAFGALAMVYARSDRIAAAIPSSAEPLAGYVSTVDAGRVWLDRTLRELVSADPAKGEG